MVEACAVAAACAVAEALHSVGLRLREVCTDVARSSVRGAAKGKQPNKTKPVRAQSAGVGGPHRRAADACHGTTKPNENPVKYDKKHRLQVWEVRTDVLQTHVMALLARLRHDAPSFAAALDMLAFVPGCQALGVMKGHAGTVARPQSPIVARCDPFMPSLNPTPVRCRLPLACFEEGRSVTNR